MIMNIWIIIGISFFVFVILILFGILVYMLFFRKVTVLTFDSKGQPFKVIQGTKKGKDIWFNKKNWTATEGSCLRFGKKLIYLAQKIDENSYTAFILDGKTIKADEHWLEALNKSYANSALKFKFGIEKYKELITLVVTTCFICILVLGAVKYTSDLTPVEAEAIEGCAVSLNSAAKYFSEGAKANKLIIEELDPQPKKTPPK